MSGLAEGPWWESQRCYDGRNKRYELIKGSKAHFFKKGSVLQTCECINKILHDLSLWPVWAMCSWSAWWVLKWDLCGFLKLNSNISTRTQYTSLCFVVYFLTVLKLWLISVGSASLLFVWFGMGFYALSSMLWRTVVTGQSSMRGWQKHLKSCVCTCTFKYVCAFTHTQTHTEKEKESGKEK